MKTIMLILAAFAAASYARAEPITLTTMAVGGLIYKAIVTHHDVKSVKSDVLSIKANDVKQDTQIKSLTESNNSLVTTVGEHSASIKKLNDYCFPTGDGGAAIYKSSRQ